MTIFNSAQEDISRDTYIIIACDSARQLHTKVNKYMQEGWRPLGAPYYTPTVHCSWHTINQAMTIDTPSIRDKLPTVTYTIGEKLL